VQNDGWQRSSLKAVFQLIRPNGSRKLNDDNTSHLFVPCGVEEN